MSSSKTLCVSATLLGSLFLLCHCDESSSPVLDFRHEDSSQTSDIGALDSTPSVHDGSTDTALLHDGSRDAPPLHDSSHDTPAAQSDLPFPCGEGTGCTLGTDYCYISHCSDRVDGGGCAPGCSLVDKPAFNGRPASTYCASFECITFPTTCRECSCFDGMECGPPLCITSSNGAIYLFPALCGT